MKKIVCTHNWLCRTGLFECGTGDKWWNHRQVTPLLGILSSVNCFRGEPFRLLLKSGHSLDFYYLFFFFDFIWNDKNGYGRHRNLHATHEKQLQTTRAFNGKNDNELMCLLRAVQNTTAAALAVSPLIQLRRTVRSHSCFYILRRSDDCMQWPCALRMSVRMSNGTDNAWARRR